MEVAVADELLRVHAAGRSRFSLMQDAPETVMIGPASSSDPRFGMTGSIGRPLARTHGCGRNGP